VQGAVIRKRKQKATVGNTLHGTGTARSLEFLIRATWLSTAEVIRKPKGK
jgi:hypothetical protein